MRDRLGCPRRLTVAELARTAGMSRPVFAEKIGYPSATAFSMAFARHVACAPGAFARALG